MINHSGFCIGSVILCVAVSYVTSHAIHYESCQTPTEEQGLCVQLEQCAFLNEMLDKMHLLFESIQYLRRSQCGSANGKVLVCCPNQDNNSQDLQLKQQGSLPEPGTCGKVISNRICGGNQTENDHYPWMAVLEYNDVEVQHFGVLINKQYVLMAAYHATNSYKNGPPIRVHLGTADTEPRRNCDKDLQNHKGCSLFNVTTDVEKVIIHEHFNESATDSSHDIALLRLASAVTFSDSIQPMCLPVGNNLKAKSFEGDVMNLVVRRRTEDSDLCYKVFRNSVPIMPIDVCQKLYSESGENIHLQGSQMCVNGAEQGTFDGAVIGMVTEDEDTTDEDNEYYFLAGIASFGLTSRSGKNVYTKVTEYTDWIQKNIRP